MAKGRDFAWIIPEQSGHPSVCRLRQARFHCFVANLLAPKKISENMDLFEVILYKSSLTRSSSLSFFAVFKM